MLELLVRGVTASPAARQPAGRRTCHAAERRPLVSAEPCGSSILCLRELGPQGGQHFLGLLIDDRRGVPRTALTHQQPEDAVCPVSRQPVAWPCSSLAASHIVGRAVAEQKGITPEIVPKASLGPPPVAPFLLPTVCKAV